MKELSKGVKKQLWNLLFVILLIGITLTVLLLSNDELNLDNIRAFFESCDPLWMACAFLFMLLSILFEGLSLHFISRHFGHRCGFHRSTAYAAADVYYSAITPSASGGQPASVYYMARDGMSVGKASFALVFNVMGYAAAIIVIGVSAFIVHPSMYGEIGPWFAHFLIILGIVLQVALLGFSVACMFCGGAVIKLGNGIIAFLRKIKLVKNPEKWRLKLAEEVRKYGDCRKIIAHSPLLFIQTLFCNVAQRLSHVLISCLVCLSAHTSVSFSEIYVMQVFVLLGYNCVPLPGGTGAFEYLYLNIYRLRFDDGFILVAMMISRVISYYVRFILSGIYTLSYHMAGGKRAKRENAQALAERSESGANGEDTPVSDEIAASGISADGAEQPRMVREEENATDDDNAKD